MPDGRRTIARPSAGSSAALDWFTFLIADVHAGFGPFLSVLLLARGWSPAGAGSVLAAAGLVGLVGQMPGGALVDLVRSERLLAAAATGLLGLCMLSLALFGHFSIVLPACLLYAASNCVLIPTINALSLGLVGHAAFGERLARNARFSSIGSALATAGMGAIGSVWSASAVFLVTAGLSLPALFALSKVRGREIDPDRAHGGGTAKIGPGAWRALARRPFIILFASIVLFHFGNTPCLVLLGDMAHRRIPDHATLVIAAAVIVSQLTLALVSTRVGRWVTLRGRRTVLLWCFLLLAVRLAAIGLSQDIPVFILLQLVDGLCAAILATAVPLVVADVTMGSGHFNLGLGLAGTALSVGASAGLATSGVIAGAFGDATAFLILSTLAGLALLVTWRFMPETKPEPG